MVLFTWTMFGLLIAGGIVIHILGKGAKKINISEFWKIFFALILFAMSKDFISAETSLKIPKTGMFVFSCGLTIWFVVSFLLGRKRKNV